MEKNYSKYIILCLSAQELLPKLKTSMDYINLFDLLKENIMLNFDKNKDKIGFISTKESFEYLQLNTEFKDYNIIFGDDSINDKIIDLILFLKRGYDCLGENYSAHPKKIFQLIFDYYKSKGINKFIIGCTDLHLCKEYLISFNINENDIISIIDVVAEKIIEVQTEELLENKKQYIFEFLTQKLPVHYSKLEVFEIDTQEDLKHTIANFKE